MYIYTCFCKLLKNLKSRYKVVKFYKWCSVTNINSITVYNKKQ